MGVERKPLGFNRRKHPGSIPGISDKEELAVSGHLCPRYLLGWTLSLVPALKFNLSVLNLQSVVRSLQ